MKKFFAVCIGLFVFCINSAFSQLSISSPTMPTISAPTLGSSFYTPGVDKRNQSAQKDNAQQKKKSNEDVIETLLKNQNSTLTASDISALNSLGLLNNFNYSKNVGNPDIYYENLYLSNSAGANNETLKKILDNLEEIKNQNISAATEFKKSQTSDTPAQELVSVQKNSSVAKTNMESSRRLLRFNVNGYDVLRTCRKIYISDVQDDGTFLVTGDRKYSSDGKDRTETFHMLFKAEEKVNGSANYKTTVAVNQDYLNEYSFLYQMTQMEDLIGKRTGNLFAVRTDSPEWKLDLLIDLGGERK